MSLSGDAALVGAPHDDARFGSAYVFNERTPATFATFGAGCSGSVGVPTLAAAPGALPWISETFEVQLSAMPANSIYVPFGVLGLSKTQWGDSLLPLDLSQFGIWNCTQYVSLDFVSVPLENMGGTATW